MIRTCLINKLESYSNEEMVRVLNSKESKRQCSTDYKCRELAVKSHVVWSVRRECPPTTTLRWDLQNAVL